ncbi:aminotransferase class IV [Paractinoplanes lichenicola]|uniref:Aminotransferase class IV n=1 Tax=Paractinoplanes lichenicola TaxID=2802976 RepID=A0ABS1VXE3_9ACTN|nr:aminotransferase class IV [Actinoplanes lichenicola]MBL7259093.1 aminotransferase class IV [Actinoplanes lichenicola]
MRFLELNGRAPDAAEIQRLASINYGHFTSMQVRDRGVRGLALHFARLADGNEEFFGWRPGLDDEHRLRQLILHALGDRADASVRVSYVFGADLDGPPDVVVAVADPASDEPAAPQRVRIDPKFRREWPEHKHAATMGLWRAQRLAAAAGFDDALSVGPDGLVREGTTWNVAFLKGDEVVWPQAPMLKGVTMVLLQIAMTMQGVPWTIRPVPASELPDFTGAVAVNSRTVRQELASIDDLKYPAGDKLAAIMAETWASVPFDAL